MGSGGFTDASLDACVSRRAVNRQLQHPIAIKSKATKGSISLGIYVLDLSLDEQTIPDEIMAESEGNMESVVERSN